MVELVGLPGAGKSTLAALLCQRLAGTDRAAREATAWRSDWLRRGGAAPRPWRRARLKASSACRHPRFLGLAAIALLRARLSWSDRLLALRLLLVNLEARRCAELDLPPGDLLIVDEGPLQIALRLFVDPGNPETRDPSRYARRLPAPDLIVHLRVPPPVAERRALERERGLPLRLQRLTGDELRATMEAADCVIDRLVGETVEAHSGCRRLVVDAGGDEPSRSADEILRRLGFDEIGDGV